MRRAWIRFSLDLNKIINENISIEDGAVKLMYGFNKSYYYKFLLGFCEANGISVKVPYAELSEDEKKAHFIRKCQGSAVLLETPQTNA